MFWLFASLKDLLPDLDLLLLLRLAFPFAGQTADSDMLREAMKVSRTLRYSKQREYYSIPHMWRPSIMCCITS